MSAQCTLPAWSMIRRGHVLCILCALEGVVILANIPMQASTSTFAGISSPLPGFVGFGLAATLLILASLCSIPSPRMTPILSSLTTVSLFQFGQKSDHFCPPILPLIAMYFASAAVPANEREERGPTIDAAAMTACDILFALYWNRLFRPSICHRRRQSHQRHHTPCTV